jgi:hypothetical protein
MQLLGNLFEEVLSESGPQMSVLGATSGDTGSTAEEALVRTSILQAHERANVLEAVVRREGALFVTSPFGGVFYPIELTFELLR